MSGKVLIIAELSANHNQDKKIALESIREIAKTGADAVKVQTFLADTMTIESDDPMFRVSINSKWDGMKLYDLYKKAYLPWEWHKELKETAEAAGILFFSTPFDNSAVDFLETIEVPFYKIASFEITDIPLIQYVASKGKPIILSTGIATLADIEEAVSVCRNMGNEDITLLHCISSYPADPKKANLRVIPNLRETFNVKVGLSDHTKGSSVSLAAVALGATVIEKHFVINRNIVSLDSEFSMCPEDFAKMIEDIRTVENALGRVDYSITEEKRKSRSLSRSLFVVKDIKKKEKFTKLNIKSIRPGFGLHPRYYKDILGKRAAIDINRGTALTWHHVIEKK